MLYKIDKNGFVVNEAGLKKIQPYYRKILEEINKLYNDKLGDNLLSIYIRWSVSVGKAKPGISDIDSIAVTKKSYQGSSILSPAHGLGGARATILSFLYSVPPSARKKFWPSNQASEKEGGLSVIPTRNFCPPVLCRRHSGVENVSAVWY